MSPKQQRPTRLFTIGGYDYVVPNPRRLALACLVLVGVAIALFMFVVPRGEGDAVPTTPASAPCFDNCGTDAAVAYPRTLVPGSPEDIAFRAAARQATSDDAFYSGYSRNLGAPARFHAYIPPTSTPQDPDYFESEGIVYLPARLLPSGSAGTFDAIVAGEQGRTILLGFERSQIPDSRYVEVWGYLYWNSVQMNPRTTGTYPVFSVALAEPVSPSAVRQPASRTYPEPGTPAADQPLLVVRRGDLRLSVGRVEFTPDQTRVHISVINLGTGASAAWDYSRATLLTANGELPLLTFSDGADPAAAPPSDILQSQELRPGGLQDATVRREGYLFFAPVDPNKEITLSLPDLNGSASTAANGGDFMRLVIPAPPSVGPAR